MKEEEIFLKKIRILRRVKPRLAYNEILKMLSNSSKNSKQIIINNFDEILNTIDDNLFFYFIKECLEYEALGDKIKDNFLQIIKRIRDKDNYNLQNFYKAFAESSNSNFSFLLKNIEELSKKVGFDFLFDVAQVLKNKNQEIDEALNELLAKHKEKIAEGLLNKNVGMETLYIPQNGIKQKAAKNYSKTLAIIIDELLKSENKKYIDIDFCGNGQFSNAYKIGEKILKIGTVRENYNMPNHRRILQPLTRINFAEDGQDIFCIEINDEVDTEIKEEEKNSEILYKMYKELRSDGIIWTDIRWENIGKLKRRNRPTLNGIEMDVVHNSIGFDKEIVDGILEKGEFVIIDTDFFYKEGQENIYWSKKAEEFEERYQKERKLPNRNYQGGEDVDR